MSAAYYFIKKLNGCILEQNYKENFLLGKSFLCNFATLKEKKSTIDAENTIMTVKKIENNDSGNNVHLRIVEGASKLFLTKGIKCVRMDDIAHELGVSKRTIYEHFEDKDQLLRSCLTHLHRYTSDKILDHLRTNSRNTLDVLLTMYEVYFAIMNRVNKQFFIDLQKLPEIKQKNDRRERLNLHKFRHLMHKGIEEGLFREDINLDVLAYILHHDLKLITLEQQFKNQSAEELGKAFILFYLRGIATPKGQQIIEQFIDKLNKKENKQ